MDKHLDILNFDTTELDNKIKLEPYYNGRALRHFIQLLEIAETICRSTTIDAKNKTVARGFANHFRRMMVQIANKPFDPNEDMTSNKMDLDAAFTAHMLRLHKLLDPAYKL